MPAAGLVYSDRYELDRVVGRGGMADVWLAHDRLLDRQVAVKVLSSGFAADATNVARFRREARAAAGLNHPNIVSVYDWGEEDDSYFIVMEYVDGQTLRGVMDQYDRLAPAEAARIAAEIADALAFAHRHGVVHRDVKPGNVLITPGGQVKVTDFGIARADATDGLTKTGAVMGTATYFSPEQAQGLELDGRSDVYALGVVLYEMVTGVAPFTADNAVSVAYKHVREEPEPPSSVEPDVPGAIDRIVLTAMAKDVDLRYQSADDLRSDLVRFERGRPLVGGPRTAIVAQVPTATTPVTTVAPGPTPPLPVASSPERRRYGAAIAIGVAIVTLLVLIGVLLSSSDFGGGKAAVPTIAVPGVVGKQYTEAAATLTDRGFKVRRREVDDSTQPVEQVLAQNPGEGEKASRGSTVVLTVVSSTVIVPSDLVGKTRQEAQTELSQLGFAANFVEEDSTQPPGTVLRVGPPEPGARVPRDPKPALTVTVAKEPPVPVPNVQGQDPTTAANILGQAGFQTTTSTLSSDTVPIGTVIDTNPAAGVPTPKTQIVTIIVSSGPEQIPIPSVVGQPQDAAAKTLTDAGFNVVIQQMVTANPAQKGIVISQVPPSGTGKRLSSVTIVVGV
jgi:eukaryotic-like serine/threonine-protein kinase